MSSHPVKKLLLNITPPCSTANSTIQSLSLSPPPPAYTHSPSVAQTHPSVPQMEHGVAPTIQYCGHHNDEDPPFSTIVLNIISPISIIGDNNIITADPAQSAVHIANTILRSIKDASTCNAGIAMIDEEGRPRPIDIQVNSGIKIEGAKNIVGEKAVTLGLQAKVLKRKMNLRDDHGEAEGGSNEQQASDIGRDAKRRKD